jgi:hypothetical protein
VNKLIKEIMNMYLPCKISPPIALPWRDVDKNVSQLAQHNKARYWYRSDLNYDFGNRVLPVIVTDDTEYPNPGCRDDDCLNFGDSAVGVDFLSKIDVECLGQISKVNDDPQEEVLIRKSTRLKNFQLTSIKNFDVK